MKGPLQALIAQAEAAPAGCDTLTRARRKQSFFRLACSFPPSGSPVALLARPPLVYRFIGRVPPAGAVRGRGACVSEVLVGVCVCVRVQIKLCVRPSTYAHRMCLVREGGNARST